nr:hypothetical protein [Tanacetum cinerariifolium]
MFDQSVRDMNHLMTFLICPLMKREGDPAVKGMTLLGLTLVVLLNPFLKMMVAILKVQLHLPVWKIHWVKVGIEDSDGEIEIFKAREKETHPKRHDTPPPHLGSTFEPILKMMVGILKVQLHLPVRKIHLVKVGIEDSNGEIEIFKAKLVAKCYHQNKGSDYVEIFNSVVKIMTISEDFLEDLFSKQLSGNPIFSPHLELTSLEVNNNIYDSEGCNVLSEKFLDIDSINDIHPHFDDNPLSGSTTCSSNSLLEEFTDELALITYPPKYDDNLQFDIESNLKEIEFLLYQGKDSNLQDSIDQTNLANLDDYFVDPTPEMFTDEHTPDYSSSSIFDVYDDDFLEVESDADNVDDDPFDSKGEKIKESKLLIDELDLPCDFLPYSDYDSFNSQDFSKVDALPSTNNEDK